MEKIYPNPTIINTPNTSLGFIKNYYFLIFAFFAFTTQSFAQTNDCATPTSISVGTTCTNTSYNVASTYGNSGAPITCGTSYRDGWYTFTTDATTTYITIDANGNRQIGLALYTGTGSCATLTQIACIFQGSGAATLTTAVSPSTTYKLRLMRTNNSGNNDMTGVICITKTCHPLTYCTTNYSSGIEPITNVTFAGINNTTAASSTLDEEKFCLTATVLRGNTYSISVNGNTGGPYYDGVMAYFDWNQDGDFTDTGEGFQVGVLYNNNGFGTPATTNITIPTGATVGTTTMRIVKLWSAYGLSCNSGGYGQTEDYVVNITAPAACTTPSTQPTALNLTPSNNTVTGSFTAASPAPHNYLVVISTNATPPSPVNGTTYTIGGTIGTGYTVIDTDSNTTFSATGLSASTLYYVYVYSFNSICTGGPLYYTTSPLTGSATTPANSTYCSPSVSGGNQVNGYITRVSFLGTLNDVTNPSGYTNSPAGYQNFTSTPKSIQAQGEGVNVFVQITTSSYMKAWIDWNKNGSFTDPGEEVYNTNGIGTGSTTFGFIIPSNQPIGDYRIRIRTNNFSGGNSSYDPCEIINNGGETEDYLFTVVASCSANIASVVNGSSCGAGPVTLSVTGTSGVTSYKWYTTETGGTAISGATSSSYTTPSISTSTYYYVTALNGTCESLVRTPVFAKINPTPTVTFTPAAPIICGDNTIISLVAGGDKEIVSLINEKFEGSGLGTFTNNVINSNGTTIDNKTSWQNRSSTFKPAEQVWYPAISSGFGTNKFAMSTSDVGSYVVENQLYSATVNSNNFLNLTLNFRMYYSRYYIDNTNLTADFVTIQVSRNGGATWPYEIVRYTSDVGIGTKFQDLSFDLSAHINQPNLKVRFLYHGEWCDGVAIDDVELFGEKPLNTAFNYNTSVVDAYTDAACTIPYTVNAPATTIYIKPTVTQLENTSFTIPVNTTLSNGCIANGSVTVTNNTKLFTPSAANSDWNTASNWRPAGVPTASNCIVVYKDLNITGPNNVERGLNLTVKAGNTLNIAPNNSIIITDFVNVENTGVFQIENNSNLVQINDVVNTGNITYKRIAPSIKGSDYVYWSSPVANQALSSIYTSPTQGPKYQWNTTILNGNGGQGNWENPSATMTVGRGYIVRGSSSFGMPATNINSTFTGIPNNGIITKSVSRGTYTGTGYNGTNGIAINKFDDNHNLLGNPYPSAINALQFLSDNSAVIEGNVKLWTHGTNPGTSITNPFYGSYPYNYSANDYITINFTGSTTPTASSYIKAGQAFFVVMLDGATASSLVTFNNAQRRNSSGAPYANDNFFKTTNQQSTNFDDLERNRIWLDIKDVNNLTETALVGYVEGATINLDSAFDALANPLDMGIYSLIDNEMYVIQGRSLPFDDNDQVSIGFNVPTTGNYSIGINTADGLFIGTQDIYLKDELLNIYHDLKSAPYSFTATTGVHNDRFKLVYKTATVLNNQAFDENEIQIAKNNNIIDIVSGNEIMDNVKVFDTRGRLIVEKSEINSNTVSVDVNAVQDQVLIVNITTSEGIKITRKIL